MKMADATAGIRHVFLHDLTVDTQIGAYDEERAKPQRVIVDVDLSVREGPLDDGDPVDRLVDYATLVTGVRAMFAAGPIRFVETAAERIAALCLADERVTRVRVRVAKPDAMPGVTVGVAIERVARAHTKT